MDRQSHLPTKVSRGSSQHASHTDRVAATLSSLSGGDAAADRVDIDWRRWVHVLWRHKWWVIAVTVVGTALSVISARGHAPIYQTRAMVWVEAPEQQGGPIEITNVFSPAGWVDLLRSYAVLDAAVHELRMYLRPARGADRPFFSEFELTNQDAQGTYKLVVRLDNTMALLDAQGTQLQLARRGDTIDAAGFRWVPPVDLPPGREVEFTVRRPRAVADGLARKLEVSMADERTNFIGLTLTGTNPEFIANILNAILDRFVDLATELKRQKLTKLASTLEEQLSLASDRLRRAESRLQTFRVNTIALPDDRRRGSLAPVPGTDEAQTASNGTGDPVFDRYFALHVERDRLRQQIEDLEAILRAQHENGSLDAMRLEAVPAVRTASSLMAALEELGRKEVEHRTLLYRYTPEHHEVEKIAGELSVLQGQTIPALTRQLIDRLETRVAELGDRIGEHTAELKRIPPRAIEESRLRRELALAEQLYNSLQFRYKEAQVAEAATQPSVRILDRASPPASPTQNTARLRIILGFVLSLGLSLAGVVAHERFVDRRIQYPNQVVEDLGLPILGVVPNLRALAAPQPADDEQASPAVQGVVESFRALRTQLTLGLRIQYPAVIAITSPGMGDGKSLITSNLALAFADPERPTVLIDGDVRRGRLHRIFNRERIPGLSDYLRGQVQSVTLVQPTETEGLYFAPRGRFSDEVPELLDGEGMPSFLAQLKQHFKVILIDTPPLSAGVDAVLMGAHADAVLAVLRRGRTDLDLARAKIDTYARMLGVPIVGAILNDVETEGPYRYYTYSYDVYADEG